MKRSNDFRLTPQQRHRDRQRAEHAYGKPLGAHPVHHHSPTQLVICEDTAYHALLHQRAYDYRMEHDLAFVEYELARIRAIIEKARRESELLRTIILHVSGWAPEQLDAELAEIEARFVATQRAN